MGSCGAPQKGSALKEVREIDINLYYQEKGKGTPFVLLHGNGEDSSYFRHQIEFFSQRYQVIAVDTRGHGKSPRGAAPFTIGQFAEDLKKLMDRLGIEAAILLGFSDGANIGMEFALQYPEKVKALILNGGNLNSKGIKGSIQLPIEIGYRAAKLFAQKSAKARRNTEMLGLMVHQPNIPPQRLQAIQAPTLVIAGTRDMVKTAHTQKIAAHIPNARLAILPGNHFIANQAPEQFNREVARFLETLVF